MNPILIIDDEPGIRAILGRLLKAEGYEIVFAQDGLEGLETAKKVHPAMILLDQTMPQMDGLSLCQLLKDNKETAGIPILFVTGEGKLGSVEDALQAGAVGYITKPFDLKRVVDKVKALIKSS
jgi:DNA-binding response OmpR family regulator